MEQRLLGNSGLKVSAIGMGCFNFGSIIDAAMTQHVVDKAVDVGISLFDTANTYGGRGKSEEFLGRALGSRRKQVLIATKFGMPMGDGPRLQGGASRDTIMRSVEASLTRLGTDYIDLYQVHVPDTMTSIAETMRALEDLVRQGKVRYIGHSNFSGSQIADAAWTAKVERLYPFVSGQNHYNVLTRAIEADIVPACQRHGLGLITYFPLESGLLSGKYAFGEQPPADSRMAKWSQTMPDAVGRFFQETKRHQAHALQEWCAKRGYRMLDVAFGWLLAKPYVSCIIAGASKPEQLLANMSALGWRPTAEDLKDIDAICPPPPDAGGRVF